MHVIYVMIHIQKAVAEWPGSQKVRGSIPAATKIVRYKNLAFNIGQCVSRYSETT